MSERTNVQVLVFPFYINDNSIEYAVFRREDPDVWQGVAGGGETGESPMETAARETAEETGIISCTIIPLESYCTIPVKDVGGFLWGDEILLAQEYSFGAYVTSKDITLSDEHTKYRWLRFNDAMELLHWESNRTALWELDYKLSKGLIKPTQDISS